jgi:hypothetical protein
VCADLTDTGIVKGRRLSFTATLLALNDRTDAIEADKAMASHISRGHVIGIVADIRAHTAAHPLVSPIQTTTSSRGSYCIVFDTTVEDLQTQMRRVAH